MNSFLRFAISMATGLILVVDQGSAAPARNPQTLYSFCSQAGCADGDGPAGGLVRGSDGAFYGITWFGGLADPGHLDGGGVIYRITRTGRFSSLHQLDSSIDGDQSRSNLTLGSDGNFYGTTQFGGTYDFGTVFRISPTGTFTVLHEFEGEDGKFSLAPPVEDAYGNWYGTSNEGGRYGRGTIYEISSDGTFHVLHDFTGRLDGSHPPAALLLGSDGNFYGITNKGGSRYSYGTIFRITPSGTLTTLHVFTGLDGEFPSKALVSGPDGALYGTTDAKHDDELHAGTVFRITLKGRFSSVHTFDDGGGQLPTSALTLMPDGYLYGVSENANSADGGSIYRISSTGSYTQLYNFTGENEGGFGLQSALVRGFDNALYGTTTYGGKNDEGTVFRYVPPATQ